MPLGLTSEQLITSYFTALSNRMNQFTGNIQAAHHGENPQMKQAIELLGKSMPGVSIEQLANMVAFFFAFFDAMVANNLAIAENVPHIERPL